ncbi:MAG: DMT family transporter [Yoonia sp.]|nr:DMT family transporter [Yoonia sp.]
MDNMRGAILMVIAMLGFAIEDSLIKIMASDLPSGQILMMLGIGGSLVFTVWALAVGQSPLSLSMLRGASGVRAVCEGIAALGFVSALALVPISLVTTIIQASPLMVTLGAALFFGEAVGWRRWMAIMVGLIGVLIVLRPFGSAFDPIALLAVVGVIAMSARDLATRQITQSISTIQLSVIGFLATIPAGAVGLTLAGASPVVPSTAVFGIWILAIAIGVPSLYCIIAAMRIGDISFVSPFRYTRIVFGLLAGLLVFDETLDNYTLIGAAIIVASGIYTLLREASLRRSQQRVKDLPNSKSLSLT